MILKDVTRKTLFETDTFQEASEKAEEYKKMDKIVCLVIEQSMSFYVIAERAYKEIPEETIKRLQIKVHSS